MTSMVCLQGFRDFSTFISFDLQHGHLNNLALNMRVSIYKINNEWSE